MKFPPPWLIAMQRYGPPPSYPHLKIPGELGRRSGSKPAANGCHIHCILSTDRETPPPPAGLNAPIPEGCSFGYQAGGWGKPPVDEYGKPLYGDVFGVDVLHPSAPEDLAHVQHWGEMAVSVLKWLLLERGHLQEESEESESESEEEEDDDVGETPSEADTSGMRTPAAEGCV